MTRKISTFQDGSPIEIKGISHFFKENGTTTYILNGINLSIESGKVLGLIGPSNGGKSVLLKIIAGILSPSKGEVLNVPKECSLMFQEGALFDSMTVFDNVSFPLTNGLVPAMLIRKELAEFVEGRVMEMLARVGLGWAHRKMPSELSGGMRRRVSLARALVTDPKLALLDDPTSGLDPVASSVILDLISEIQEEKKATLVLVSHDLRRLIPRCDRIACLFDSAIKHYCQAEDVLKVADEAISYFISCRYNYTYTTEDSTTKSC